VKPMASENQGGSRSSTSSRAISAAQKQRKALELRRTGASFDVIAQQVVYSSTGGAYKPVQAGLKKPMREPGESVRKLELERLDRLLLGVWYRAPQWRPGSPGPCAEGHRQALRDRGRQRPGARQTLRGRRLTSHPGARIHRLEQGSAGDKEATP
jgi:hypothetical protein